MLNLHQGDFSTTAKVSEAINDVFGGGVAVPLDSTTIKVRCTYGSRTKSVICQFT